MKNGDGSEILYTKDDGEYCEPGIAKYGNNTYSDFIKWNNIYN
ncbi:hypothetical protein [Eubacterium sp.]